MKKNSLFIIACLFTLQGFSQIHDTTELISIVESLDDITDHKNFWEKIYEDDQETAMNAKNNYIKDSINERNLLQCSTYFNRFGDPDSKILGYKSQICNYVWVHNKYHEIKKLSFPIIFKGYMNKEISEDKMRKYFLRILYLFEFDDYLYKNGKIKDILTALNLKVQPRINVTELICKLDSLKEIEASLEINITKYSTQNNKNNRFEYELRKTKSGNIYIGSSLVNREFREIDYFEENKFRLKNRKSNSYFEINDEGNLVEYRKNNRKIIYYVK